MGIESTFLAEHGQELILLYLMVYMVPRHLKILNGVATFLPYSNLYTIRSVKSN